jgi:hypothetical protein
VCVCVSPTHTRSFTVLRVVVTVFVVVL